VARLDIPASVESAASRFHCKLREPPLRGSRPRIAPGNVDLGYAVLMSLEANGDPLEARGQTGCWGTSIELRLTTCSTFQLIAGPQTYMKMHEVLLRSCCREFF
jgi:hypothetical protein